MQHAFCLHGGMLTMFGLLGLKVKGWNGTLQNARISGGGDAEAQRRGEMQLAIGSW
jgi:hypothetical protein